MKGDRHVSAEEQKEASSTEDSSLDRTGGKTKRREEICREVKAQGERGGLC